jgi:beta-phosphoglucomutase-like phosphatase (HAD superfamily)
MSVGTFSERRRRAARPPDDASPPAPGTQIVEPQPVQVDLNVLRTRWRSALRSADRALQAAGHYLTGAELIEHRARLTREYEPTVRLLRALAHDEGAALHYAQPFVPPGEARRLLGLPPGVTACVFNVDGVLVGSAEVHAAAWTRTFDELLSGRPELTHGQLAPFDPNADYQAHLHGRPRLEGVRTFLASRGIRLPEGSKGDPPGAETVHGLANRKTEVFARLLEERGVDAYEGSQRYLELAQDAGVRCATVSASAHSETILERTGLDRLIDARVDAELIVAEHLAGRPSPDRLLAACRLLGVEPLHAAVYEPGTAGIAAGRAAGFRAVIGIDRSDHASHAAALRAEGADLVVSSLADLIDRSPRLGLA